MAAWPPPRENSVGSRRLPAHRKKKSSCPVAVVAPLRSVVLVVHVCPETDLGEDVVGEVVEEKGAGPRTAVAEARAPMARVATAGAFSATKINWQLFTRLKPAEACASEHT